MLERRIIRHSPRLYEKRMEKEKSWFSERINILINLLNKATRSWEKEFTIEYVCDLIDEDVNEFKKYLMSDIEPGKKVKQKLIDFFGVNEAWMLFGQGKYPFASNIKWYDNDPMDILRREKIADIESFILVIGYYEHARNALIIREKNKFCLEVYPKAFILNSSVGCSGTRKLTNMYRFIREADKRGKLYPMVYEANEEQFKDLLYGKIAPNEVKQYRVIQNFIYNFLELSELSLQQKEENWNWDSDLIKVQRIIRDNLNNRDKIDQESDMNQIHKNMLEQTKNENWENNYLDITKEGNESNGNSIDNKIEGNVLKALINVQKNMEYWEKPENIINDGIRDQLSMLYDVHDQTRQGESESGKASGEVDMVIYKDKFPIAIIEGMRLKSFERLKLDSHISKALTKYDPLGCPYVFVLIYISVKEFSEFYHKLIQYLREYTFPYTVYDMHEIESVYTETKQIDVSMNRSGKKVHLCVNLVNFPQS